VRYAISLIVIVSFGLSVIETGPAQAGAELAPGRAFHDCPVVCPEMVVLPAGEFIMGSPPGEADRLNNEGPQHRVTIARPFAVGKFEITFAEWDACTADEGCKHRPGDAGWGRGRRPVIGVSWDDAKEYVNWLSRKTGKSYRLLTEAEWEYAARAGTTTRYAFGDMLTSKQAQYGGRGTAEVGSFAPNAFNLHDMHGNVWEWVEDSWHSDYQSAPTDGSAWLGGDVSFRVLRGGAWILSSVDALRSASRAGGEGVDRLNNVGFRVARTL
jgi:formylglycine-generating enzyme required for sulfatase activity